MIHAIEIFIGAHWLAFLFTGIALIVGSLETPDTYAQPKRRNIRRVIVRAHGVRIYHNRPGEN